MSSCSLFKDVHGWQYCDRKKKSPQAFRQESHLCTSQHTLYAKNSLGCCLRHCITAYYTSLMWIWGLSLRSKDTKIVWQKVLIIFQMFQRLPLRGIRLPSVSSQTAIRMKWMPYNFHTFGLKGPHSCQKMCGQLWYNDLGNSPRNSLHMGYIRLCINGVPA
jgi:hypothetical protein